METTQTRKPFVDPLISYRAFRNQSPVLKMDALSGWLVTGYAECLAILKNTSVFSSRRMDRVLASCFPGYSPDRYPHLFRFYSRSVVFLDPPDHGPARARLRHLFTPETIEPLRKHTGELLEGILDEAESQGGLDIQRQIANYLPMAFTAKLIDLPLESLVPLRETIAEMVLLPGVGEDPLERGEKAMVTVIKMLKPFLRSAGPESPLRSFADKGDEEDEFFDGYYRLIQILIAGFLTAIDMLGVGFLTFLEHPGQKQKFMERPDLQGEAIEEVLRYTSPAQLIHRVATRDIELAGQKIRRGDLVYPVLAAANRDPAVFDDPDRFDIERQNVRKQIAFGAGPHLCPGAPQARMLASVIFPRVFQRLPGLRLSGAPVWRTEGLAGRGLHALPAGL